MSLKAAHLKHEKMDKACDKEFRIVVREEKF